MAPSDRITLWQGTAGSLFFDSALPTARYAFGEPTKNATSLYVSTLPLGMVFTAAHTLSVKESIGFCEDFFCIGKL